MSRGTWTAAIRVRLEDPAAADRLFRSLSPEAEREVPKARTELRRDSPARLSLTIATPDTGALRAALNTYLGWIDLAAATERVGRVRGGSGAPSPEALK
jgi:tRNA threonylcarbamoyladenosine modification (KEOPS) complex  Pcc1 subunit